MSGTVAEYRFWEVGSWQQKHSLPRENPGKSHGASVFSPVGKMLAVLHSMTEVRLVDPATGREFARLPSAGRPYCFSPDGSQLATYAGRDGAVHVWDLRLIRRQLKEMDLDWDLPPYPPPAENAKPLRVQVVAGERPLPSNEQRAAAYLERGLLYVQSRKYGSAVVDFDRANLLDPSRPPWEAVVRAYSQALERDPENTDLYHVRAHAHERLGQWDQSIGDHGQVLKRAGPRPDLLVCRGRAYLRAGQKERAAEDFLKAGDQSPDQANYLAWELATSPDPGNREPRLAVALARKATGQAPGAAAYWTTLGVAHYRLGDWEAAMKALEEAEKRAPGQRLGSNAFFLAMCRYRLGDPAQAREHYDRAAAWSQENEGKLSGPKQKELRAFRAEAEALLGTPPPGP